MGVSGRVLITGAAGFVGGHLIDSWKEKDCQLVSVDLKEHFTQRNFPAHRDFGTVVDRGDLFCWLEKNASSLQVIYHLGACTDTNNFDEAYLSKANLKYSQELWECATKHQIPFYYASSAATYGAGDKGFDDDESLLPDLQPLNPYGLSKHQFDLWVLEREKVGQTPPQWAGFKFFNVYGVGEEHKKNMASYVFQAIRQMESTGKIRLFKSHLEGWGHGQQKRDFIFVGDVIKVLLFALDKPITRGIFNLGTGEARSYLDLAQAIFRQWDREENIEFFDMPEKIKSRFQYFTEAKVNRLRQEGYEEDFTSLEEGLKQYLFGRCSS